MNAQSDVKQAVAAKDATLSAQDAQIKSLQNELDVTKEELSVTRDGLNQATMELENVCVLHAPASPRTRCNVAPLLSKYKFVMDYSDSFRIQ